MTRYANLGGNSNVEAYDIGHAFIDVKFFGTPKVYRYSCAKAGRCHVDNLINLARQGRVLNSYINRHVKKLYD